MIHCLRRAVLRWRRDRGGNVGVAFSLCVVPATLVAGGAIDYSRALTKWSNLQQAADATALTVAHAYLNASSTETDLQVFAQKYVSGLMNGAQVVGNPKLSQNNTVVCVSLSYAVPTVFMKIARVDRVTVSTSACSQVGQTYEVAMALDNSGSMQDSAGGTSKIQSLKKAAKKLVNILIPAGQASPQVAISIVPFNSLVNVGASQVSQTILDTAGKSSIHWQNFHRPFGAAAIFRPTSKFDLLTNMNNTTWGGCIEEPPPPYTTTDQTFSTSTPDSTFVPYFAPDEPGPNDNFSGAACYPVPAKSSDCTIPRPNGATFSIFGNSYLADANVPADVASNTTIGVCNKSTLYKDADNAAIFAEDNQKNIYPSSGATMVCKYKGSTPAAVTGILGSEVNATSGPNFLCNSQAVTPLTTDQALLTRANTGPIDSMVAQGSTDLATGFMWAWRSLSPIVNAFPTISTAAIGPQNAKSYTYGPPANQKIIILMTDGQNTWLPNPYSSWGSLYESFGYTANQRIASYINSNGNVPGSTACGGTSLNGANANCALDNVFLEACKNAKDNKIIVYTIGVSAKPGDVDADVLKACATAPSTSHYFAVSDDNSMTAAFQAIAASILSLRLTQ